MIDEKSEIDTSKYIVSVTLKTNDFLKREKEYFHCLTTPENNKCYENLQVYHNAGTNTGDGFIQKCNNIMITVALAPSYQDDRKKEVKNPKPNMDINLMWKFTFWKQCDQRWNGLEPNDSLYLYIWTVVFSELLYELCVSRKMCSDVKFESKIIELMLRTQKIEKFKFKCMDEEKEQQKCTYFNTLCLSKPNPPPPPTLSTLHKWTDDVCPRLASPKNSK